jgi:hypothetical protein
MSSPPVLGQPRAAFGELLHEQHDSQDRHHDGEDDAQDERDLLSRCPSKISPSLSAAGPSVSAVYYWSSNPSFSFLGAHIYTFHVRPPPMEISYPYPTPRRSGEANLVAVLCVVDSRDATMSLTGHRNPLH